MEVFFLTLKNRRFLFEILSDILFIFATSLLFATKWARINYPMDNCYTVFFVMSSDTSGHDSGTFLSIIFGFIIPTIVTFIIYRSLLFILQKKIQKISYKIVNWLNIVYTVFAAILSVCLLKAWNYPIISYEINKKPVDSSFYKENYIEPSVVSPKNRRNLILIFMESMESSYQHVNDGGVLPENPMPFLMNLAKESINFSDNDGTGGGYNIEGTCWTVGGLLSKTSGLPYYNPFRKVDEKLVCLKNAIFLADVLKKDGYNAVFSIGSEKQFENRDSVMESHNYEIHDINWYKQNKKIPSDYRVFWGFEDEKLYELAKEELSNLSAKNEPFLFTMLTVDTHFPHGFVCNNCENNFENQMLNVLACADKLLENFMKWAKTQSWYENTEFVIVGDHNYLGAPKNNFMHDISPLSIDEVESRRRFMNVFVNTEVPLDLEKQKNRRFSSFDIMPTILESMGYELKNHGAALGRSLYSNEQTMIEKYGVKKVNEEIMKRTVQYDSLCE